MSDNNKSIIELFLRSEINWEKYPMYNKTAKVREKSYLVMYISELEFNNKYLSAPEIAAIGLKKFKDKNLSKEAIRITLIRKIGDEVDFIERDDGIQAYCLLPKALTILDIKKEKIDLNFTSKNIIFPMEIFEDCKDYIIQIAVQIDGCYRDCYYDACSTLLRRLLETLIIEIYIKKGFENEIKDSYNNYMGLKDLIYKIVNDKRINLGRATKSQLPKIKLYGDTGAHSRRIILKKFDIDTYKDDIRLSFEDLIAELK